MPVLTSRACRARARLMIAAAALVLLAGCERPVLPAGAGCDAGGPLAGGIDMLVLLDASGSMNDDADNFVCPGGCGAASKWALASAAINSVVAETDASLNWGLMLFGVGGNSCSVGNPNVPVGPGQAAAIASAIAARTSANGGVLDPSRTATRAALQAATESLATTADGNRKLLLLLTDGLPNCVVGSADSAADDSVAAAQAVTDARSRGIPTVVVGIATEGGPADATLTSMAIAGGLARAAPPPAYYPVARVGDLTGTLHTLICHDMP
jgi:hypothetical protein